MSSLAWRRKGFASDANNFVGSSASPAGRLMHQLRSLACRSSRLGPNSIKLFVGGPAFSHSDRNTHWVDENSLACRRMTLNESRSLNGGRRLKPDLFSGAMTHAGRCTVVWVAAMTADVDHRGSLSSFARFERPQYCRGRAGRRMTRETHHGRGRARRCVWNGHRVVGHFGRDGHIIHARLCRATGCATRSACLY